MVSMESLLAHPHHYSIPRIVFSSLNHNNVSYKYPSHYRPERLRTKNSILLTTNDHIHCGLSLRTAATAGGTGIPHPPLDLTEENIKLVLADARVEFGQIFDTSVGMTGVAELAELDGPFVKISLRGRFWHERSLVIARLGNYLKQRIPEILEVDIEDEKQLDDSPANF